MKPPAKPRTFSYADFILLNGEYVRIKYADDDVDEFFETIEHSMKLREWWSADQFDGCEATYIGQRLGRVNMGLVVGMP